MTHEHQFFTTEELLQKKFGTFIMDVESYENYFLVAFKCIHTNKIAYFEAIDLEEIPHDWIAWMITNFCIVGFNIKKYDLVVIGAAVSQQCTVKNIHDITGAIIYRDARPSEIENEWNFKIPITNNVDLIEVAPLRGSLKVYAARLHCRHLQDLPFHPDTILTREQIAITRTYCFNDLDNTHILLNSLNDQLELRAALSDEYKQDLRSKSDAQIAEAVIASELERLTGSRIKRPKVNPATIHRYNVPTWLSYETPQLREMLELVRNAQFRTREDGVMIMPSELQDKTISIGNGIYRMGIGGLHSSETCIAHKATDDIMLIDRDVTSYYPNIILTLGLYPSHIGEAFLTVYRNIVERRAKAKKANDYVGSESLKITTNGTFGKLGSPYSIFYAPDLMVQVTLTGQLALLKLIEMLELYKIEVISANTDGVVSKVKKTKLEAFKFAVRLWEDCTGFQTEETLYKAVYSRDVNNYIAVMADGSKSKSIGAYKNPWDDPKKQIFRLFKNPTAMIVIDAAIEHIVNGTPIADTITQCQEIERFVVVRKVTGGAQKDGRYLGVVIRWYYARGIIGAINGCLKGHTVNLSDGGRPLMTLPDIFPNDVDYAAYIRMAVEILKNVGFQPKKNEQMKLL